MKSLKQENTIKQFFWSKIYILYTYINVYHTCILLDFSFYDKSFDCILSFYVFQVVDVVLGHLLRFIFSDNDKDKDREMKCLVKV